MVRGANRRKELTVDGNDTVGMAGRRNTREEPDMRPCMVTTGVPVPSDNGE